MRLMLRGSGVACLALAVLVLTGCAQQERVVQMASPSPTAPAPEPGSAASKILLRGMANDVKVVDVRAQKRAGLLAVQTEIVNDAATQRTVYWRYRWLDEAGMQVGDDETWKPLPLLGHQSSMLRSSATQPRATDFRLEMNVEPR